MDLNNFTLLLFSCCSALITFLLSGKLNFGPVRASALVGGSIALFFYVFPSIFNSDLSNNLPVACFGASFIGMVSSRLITNYILIVFSVCVFTFIYLNTSSLFHGFGGSLGAIACISILVTIGLTIVLNKFVRLNRFFFFKNQYLRWKFKR